MSILHVYKASAGSGKTYRLSLEFLKYVIQDPTSFERILAVTFTNKATSEMKTRIITTLYGVAKDFQGSQNDIEALIRELTPLDTIYSSHSYIVSQARKALSLMLHNYSHFHIETIDSFFQTVLRTLEKELGLGTHLNIELDGNSILSESAEALMDDIPNDKRLEFWIRQYLKDKLDSDSSWNIAGEIANFGKIIFTEDFKKHANVLFEFLERDNALSQYKQSLEDYKKRCIADLKGSAQHFFDLNAKNGFTVEQYYHKKSGVWGYFTSIMNDDFSKAMNSYVTGFYEGDDNKLSKDKSVRSCRDDIFSILDETEKKRQKYLFEINTVDIVNKNLFNVGLLHYLDKKLKTINAEKNQFILSDTQALLNAMIQDSDTPFIYEKIGTYLDHIMIDEFQDTSETQWRNFKPLISECLSRSMGSLVVGDPKQSIYRFRNGKWELLGNLKNEFSAGETKEVSLDTNWRSELNIVRFNNKVFSFLPQKYSQFGVVDTDYPLLKSMVEAYEDAPQKCNKASKREGFVRVNLFDEKDSNIYKERTLEELANAVKEVQLQGVQAEQIAILIRSNGMVTDIANYFSEYKEREENQGLNLTFDIISEEAYMLESSEVVQAIISTLRYISVLNLDQNGKHRGEVNRMAKVQLLHAFQKVTRRDEQNILPPNPDHLDVDQQKLVDSIEELRLLPLYEMVEEIYRIMSLELITGQENYYCFFLDRLNDFLTKKSSNLRLFLRYWDEKLHNMTIPSGESNGIKVMTIHKSKGLEFHTVFIPFCDWEIGIDSNKPKHLWESMADLPKEFNSLPFTAVKCVNTMLNSHFRQAYMKELVETYMDNLNVFYVALTRAEKNMFIFGKKIGENGNLDSVSHLLQVMFQTDYHTFSAEDARSSLWEEMSKSERLAEESECISYEFGCLENENEKSDEEKKQQKEEKQEKQQEVNPFSQIPEKEEFQVKVYTQKGRFRQSNKSNDFIGEMSGEGANKESEFIKRGNKLHYIFSQIGSGKDVERIINQLEFDGVIQSAEKPALMSGIQRVLASEKGKKWFAPGLQLYNECSIIFRNEGKIVTKRPDRVIKEGNHMTVIDFKFGKPSDGYVDQINLYVQLLKQMGFEAEGHLWYLDEYFPK